MSTTLRSGRRVRSHAPVTAVMKSFARVPGIQDEVDRWCLSSAQSWSLGPAMTVLLKVMDELVSNALEHGVGQVEVDLRLQGGRVWIGVRDEGAGPIRSDDGRFPPHDEAHGLGRGGTDVTCLGCESPRWPRDDRLVRIPEIGARGATSDDASSS